MPSISFPAGPTNYPHLPLEIKEKIIHETVNAITSSDKGSQGAPQTSTTSNSLSSKEILRNQSSRLFTLMNVNTEFMTLVLNDLRRNPDPKITQSLTAVALNSILRKRTPKAFEDVMKHFLKSASYIDLSHRSVAFTLSSERLAFIIEQLAATSASNLKTAILHISKSNEWDKVKEKIAQIHQANPDLAIHVAFPERTEPGSVLPPPDLAAALSENENIKGLKIFRLLHSHGASPAQFFSFLPSSSINELTLQRVSTEDLQGLSEVLLAPGCKLNTLNLGKKANDYWSPGIANLTPMLENPASPVKRIQLDGPWGTVDAEPLLDVAGNNDSPLKELDFSGVTGAERFVPEIRNQVEHLTARGIKITLP
ncbi:hypothetical protein [Noviherbaspirillum aerium]|uniref:hypothetical protein n=1 Tax=Noviherbaspirillum aerium TaxID=2588497 RepID=UPI00124D98D9|nr:hypothetical protein [Noviherbaspirillum aerium]